jgi:protein TonB
MNRVLPFICLLLLAVVPNPTCTPPAVIITPEHATLSGGERQQFSAELREGGAEEISWILLRGPGILSDDGLYKAPYHVPHRLVVTLSVNVRRAGTGEKEHGTVDITLDPGDYPGADSCCSTVQGKVPEPQTTVPIEAEPEPVVTVAPEYPEEAKALGIEGRVLVGALVCRDGTVLDTWIFESIPELDEAATTAIRQWEFRPARMEGEDLAAWVTIPVPFTLSDSSGTFSSPEEPESE